MLYDASKFDGGDVPDILANLLSQPKENKDDGGPLSILKNFAKTIFNKCSGAKAQEPKLSPMEQAKFDAAQKMMREGKTTRYAYYKYKEEFEQPILQDYRAVFEGSDSLSDKTRDLSDWAMRKLAGFLDNVDQDHLVTLKQDQNAYEAFLGEAYDIATAHGKRSKLRSITAVMNDALGIAPEEKTETAEVKTTSEASTEGVLLLVNPIVPGRDMSAEEPQAEAEEELVDDGMDTFTLAELEEMILKNLGQSEDTPEEDVITPQDLAEDLNNFAEKLNEPLKQLEAKKGEYGLPETSFKLLKNFLGMNGNNRSRHNNIKKMCTVITAFHAGLSTQMYDDLKDGIEQGDFTAFHDKYAALLSETYEFVSKSGIFLKAEGEINVDEAAEFYNKLADAYHGPEFKYAAPETAAEQEEGVDIDDEPTTFGMDNLYNVILGELAQSEDTPEEDVVTKEMVAEDIALFADVLDAPLRQLADNMSAYGIDGPGFRLLENFVGGTGSNRSRHNNIAKMGAVIGAFNLDLADEMYNDAKEAREAGDYGPFLDKHASVLSETYNTVLRSGLFLKAEGMLTQDEIAQYSEKLDIAAGTAVPTNSPSVSKPADVSRQPIAYTSGRRAAHSSRQREELEGEGYDVGMVCA